MIKAANKSISESPAGVLSRLWVFQRERFPLVEYIPLIFIFSCSAVTFSWLTRSTSGWPDSRAVAVAFVTCLTFFLQLRIADEFKDAPDDARYRPYRPLPRGLVTRRELAVVFALALVLQLIVTFALSTRLLLLLFVAWAYLALMCKEFFVKDWLHGKHFLYMVLHMPIVAFIVLYANGTDWFVNLSEPPAGLLWLLLATVFNGVALEIRRKLRIPEDEQEGVPTYSVVWGRDRALAVWWLALLFTFVCACLAVQRLGLLVPTVIILTVTLLVALFIGFRFQQKQSPRMRHWIENCSAGWTLLLYLSLGPVPLLWREFG